MTLRLISLAASALGYDLHVVVTENLLKNMSKRRCNVYV